MSDPFQKGPHAFVVAASNARSIEEWIAAFNATTERVAAGKVSERDRLGTLAYGIMGEAMARAWDMIRAGHPETEEGFMEAILDLARSTASATGTWAGLVAGTIGVEAAADLERSFAAILNERMEHTATLLAGAKPQEPQH